MDIKKITCLFMSALFIIGTASNTNNIKSVYGEENVESSLEKVGSLDEAKDVSDSDSAFIENSDTEKTEVNFKIEQEEIKNEESTENSSITEEDNTRENDEVEKVEETVDVAEDNKLQNIEESSEIEEDEEEFIEETKQYGERKTGIERDGFGAGSTVYYYIKDYDSMKLKSYTDRENSYTNEGGSINPNNDLIITVKGVGKLDLDPTRCSVCVGDIYLDCNGKEGDNEDECEIKIPSAQLRRLNRGKNELLLSIRRWSGSGGNRYSSGSYTSYTCYTYLNINIEDSIKELELNEDNAVFRNGEIVLLNCSDEERKQITSVIIPEKVDNQEITKIGDSLFEGFTNLRSVSIANTITTIGDRAFKGCKNLAVFEFPSSVKVIGKEAFKDSGLKEISIDYDYYDIDKTAFDGCKIDVVTVNKGEGLERSYQENKLLKIAKGVNVIQPGKEYKYYKTNEMGKYGIARINIPEGTSCIFCDQYSYSDYPCLEVLVVPNSTSISGRSSLYDRNREYIYFEGSTPKHIYAPITLVVNYNTIKDREELMKIINADLEAKYVVTVSDSSFSLENSNVWEAYINNDIKHLSKNAFRNCRELTYISIPYDCEIDQTTFKGCYNLSTVDVYGTTDEEVKAKVKEKIENSILGIGEKIRIANFTDKASNEAIVTEDIFEVNDGIITGLNISDADKAELKTIIVPDEINGMKINGIGGNLFNGCSELTSVILPNTINTIGSGAFVGCSNLTDINIPEGVTELSDAIFSGCTSLTKVTLPSTISKIGSWSFLNCYNLKEVNIPENVTEIGDMSFINGWNLKEIYLPDTITSIGKSAFENCVSVERIQVPYNCVDFDKSTFKNDNNAKVIIISGGDASEKAYMKEKIKKSIKDEDIGEYVPQIKGNIATYTDKASNAAILDDSIFKVENGILTDLNISESDKAELTSIEIPENINGTDIVGIGESLFNGCTSLSNVEIPQSIEKIYNAAFIGCSSLEKIIIPEGVKEIGDACFAGCDKLETITLPSTLAKLSSYLFNGCFNLKNINIPESIEEIGTMTFYNCWNLEDIVFSQDLKSIGDSAFTGCLGIKNICIPNSVTYLGNGVFEECRNLQSVKLPRNITAISERMFKNCVNLEIIEMPHIVTKMGKDAIKGCSKIKSMKMQA